MKVGGRDFNDDKHNVEKAMKGEYPEDLREHYVEVNGKRFPPKQVLATMTGWERSTFTTMEAQRVLTKIGFTCMRVHRNRDGMELWATENEGVLADDGVNASESDASSTSLPPADRLAALEAALATAQEAIIGLGARVRILEGRG